MLTGKRCFFDDKEWHNIQIDDSGFPLMPENHGVYLEGLNHFARKPGVIERLQRVKHTETSDDIAHVCLEAEIEAETVRSDMIEWFEKLQSMPGPPMRILLRSAADTNSSSQSVYEYEGMMSATFAVNYAAYLIKLMTLAEDICLSVAYCSRGGFCGNQAIAFALPLALSALPKRCGSWVQQQIKLLERIQESSALRSAMLEDAGSLHQSG